MPSAAIREIEPATKIPDSPSLIVMEEIIGEDAKQPQNLQQPTNNCSPIQQILQVIEHKIRNLEKRKVSSKIIDRIKECNEW